jgi:uncharacterized membrane protein
VCYGYVVNSFLWDMHIFGIVQEPYWADQRLFRKIMPRRALVFMIRTDEKKIFFAVMPLIFLLFILSVLVFGFFMITKIILICGGSVVLSVETASVLWSMWFVTTILAAFLMLFANYLEQFLIHVKNGWLKKEGYVPFQT